MARRNDHTRDELKALILKTSWDIIGEEGLSCLTARRIAKEIGYTPGTIYNIFSSMDALHLSINACTLDKLYAALCGAEGGGAPAQDIKALAKAYKEFSAQYRPYWLMLFASALPDGAAPPDWYQDKVTRLFAPLEALMRPLYPDTQDQRCRVAVRALWASVHGLCILEETGKLPLVSGACSQDEMMDYLIETFVAGIAGVRHDS